MPIYITCVASGSGLPIFTRSKGNVKNLPFSVIGSLNGVHMFSKSHKMELVNTNTQEYKIVWKEFYDSLILIGVSSSCTVLILQCLLDSVFNTLVLILGIEQIKSQRNIERLKRELKVLYPIIDRLMDSLNSNDVTNKNPSELVGMVETILCSENHLIQIVLDSYTEYVDSMFSCLLIHGKLAVATENWWTLHPEEMKLLSLLAASENASSKDVPVYLPYKSPNAAFRFVVCTLIPNVQVCSLCGQTPSLSDIETSASQCFKNTQEILNSAILSFPRNLPSLMQLDPGILGILLISTKYGKYVISKNPQQNSSKRTTNGSHRLDILKTFYYEAILRLLSIKKDADEGTEDNKPCIGKETYWCSEYHKCHAAIVDDNILCVLYNSSVPTHAMRVITCKTMKALISDKQVGW